MFLPGERYYPAFLDIRGRLVVIIGGGTVAEETVGTMLDFGADVLVIAPQITPGIDLLVAEGRIEHEQRGYIRGDLAGAFIVFSATDCVETDRAVYQEAEGMGCLVSIAEEPCLGNFITPVHERHSELMAAIDLDHLKES